IILSFPGANPLPAPICFILKPPATKENLCMAEPNTNPKPEIGPKPGCGQVSRRSFLRSSALALSGVAAVAAALEPLRDINDPLTLQRFFQKHYKQMTPQDMEKVLARISAEVEKQYKIRPHVKDYKPLDGVEFVYCLNLTRCIGCRKCVHACV